MRELEFLIQDIINMYTFINAKMIPVETAMNVGMIDKGQ
jgi:hypothetical protein